MDAIDLKLVMQVWAGRQAGRANVTNNLPLLDGAARFDALGEALHVAVKRAVRVAMLNDDGVAVAATTACK